MNALLVKMLAIGLTLSQLFTRPPEQFKTHFNPTADQAQVQQLLTDGCGEMTKEFGLEKINFETLLTMMVANVKTAKEQAAQQQAGADGSTPEKTFAAKIADQIDVDALLASYKMFCRKEGTDPSIKLGDVIEFYNAAFAGVNLEEFRKLKGMRLKEASEILDRNGHRFSEIYSENNRRRWISIKEIPPYVQKAFVSAEDKRFYQHNGVDLRGIIRAFANNFMNKGRPQGGSTITQQVIKNLVAGDDVTFERKMREMVMAVRMEKEHVLSKDEILELYLNLVFLGRASWGVEMASQSYFGKSVRQLTVSEAAFLAGLTKGPNYYQPDRYPERVEERRQYVLARMKEDKYIDEQQYTRASAEKINLIKFETPRMQGGYYYLDAINRDAHKVVPKIDSLTSGAYTVYSTINPDMQKLAEEALRDGLADYEAASGRARWSGTEGNIADVIERYKSTWQDVLPKVRGVHYDVRWPLAVVLTPYGGKVSLKSGRSVRSDNVIVGLSDGRTMALNGSYKILKTLKPYDIVFAVVNEKRRTPVADLKIPPHVQGATVVLENKTGRVLAMAGGFSYATSQFNRVTQAVRQPGSALKPFIYLAALNLGFQPNTLIPDIPVQLPPILHGGHWWTPKNYDGGSRGVVTLRTAVEKSLNLPTARMMTELGRTATEGLDYIRGVTQELGIYPHPIREYPFVLGAQPANLLNMAVAYATIANDGLRPTAHFIDRIEQDGRALYERPRFSLTPVNSVDRVAFYQTRQILEGVVVRGTADRLQDLAGYVAGKTGTSNDENDAWFMGFTNDVVVGVWVGYDTKAIRASLGDRFTGARVALPIAEKVLRGSFDVFKSKEALPGPPQEIRNQIREIPIDVRTGRFNAGRFMETFRVNGDGSPRDTTHAVLKGAENYLQFTDPQGEEGQQPGQWPYQYLAQGEEPQLPDFYQMSNAYSRGSYQPGYDDMSDGWQRQPPRQDPFLMNPLMFGQ